MTFQSSVRIDQTTGIVGEVSFDAPMSVLNYNLNTTDEANNVIGRAFTLGAREGEVAAGGTTAFAGILVNPKNYALQGTSAGTLEPTLMLPNNTNAQLLRQGSIFVVLSTAATQGQVVAYEDTTGILGSYAAGTVPVGSTQILGASVIRRNVTAAGDVALISISPQTATA